MSSLTLEDGEGEESKEQLIVPKNIPPLSLNSDSSYQMTQKVISKLLTHSGFEGAKTGAMNVLTDIMIDYITNIGKTMRSYWDSYSHEMNGDVSACMSKRRAK